MAEEPVRDALGAAVLRGAVVQIAGRGGELGVVTSTGGGDVVITIGGRGERYTRQMAGIVMTVVPPGRNGEDSSGSSQSSGEEGTRLAVDRNSVPLQVGDRVHVAGGDFPYDGSVQSISGNAVVVRASRARNLKDVVRRFGIGAAATLMTVTASSMASRKEAPARQSRRLRGVPAEGPRDRRGRLLAVGNVVAVSQIVGDEPCECTGFIQHIATLCDTPQITIGYHTESAVMTFDEVRACVRRLKRPPDLCMCGRCKPDDGGGGLCSAAWDAPLPTSSGSDVEEDQSDSVASTAGDPVGSDQPGASGHSSSASGSTASGNSGGSGEEGAETPDNGRAARAESAGSEPNTASAAELRRELEEPPPRPAGSAARRRARAKHVRRAGRRRRLRDGDAYVMAMLGDNPPRLSDRQLTERLRGRHDGRRADLSADDFVMADFFSGTKSMGMSAQRMYRTWGLTIDVREAFSPDVVSDFLDFDLWGYFLEEFSFIGPDGSEMIWVPLHFHFSPSCLTYSTGSAWLSGRSRMSPYADGLATEEAHNADACAVDIANLILFMKSYGCVTTFTIENPGGSKLWLVLEAILGGELGEESAEEVDAGGVEPVLTRTVVHYCAYGAEFRKPTTIAHSPALGRGWARKCVKKSGKCGATRGGVHGSPGGFTLRDAGIPRALCDGLNLAWRAHHAPLRAENPLHGALPRETVLEMQAEWQKRRRHVGAAAPAVSEEESFSSAHETPDPSSSDPEWDDGGELHFSEYDCLAGDVGAVVCEFCAIELAPHVASAPDVAPPSWPECTVVCGLCGIVPAEGELSVAGETHTFPSCSDCFLQHFAFQKGECG